MAKQQTSSNQDNTPKGIKIRNSANGRFVQSTRAYHPNSSPGSNGKPPVSGPNVKK